MLSLIIRLVDLASVVLDGLGSGLRFCLVRLVVFHTIQGRFIADYLHILRHHTGSWLLFSSLKVAWRISRGRLALHITDWGENFVLFEMMREGWLPELKIWVGYLHLNLVDVLGSLVWWRKNARLVIS